MFEKGLIFRIQKERLQFNKRQIKGKGSEQILLQRRYTNNQ